MEVIIAIVAVIILVKLISSKVKQKEVHEEKETKREAEEAANAQVAHVNKAKEELDKLTDTVVSQQLELNKAQSEIEFYKSEIQMQQEMHDRWRCDAVRNYCIKCKEFTQEAYLPIFDRYYETFARTQRSAREALERFGEDMYKQEVDKFLEDSVLIDPLAKELMQNPNKESSEEHLTTIFLNSARSYYNDQLDQIADLKRKDAIIRHYETGVRKLEEGIILGENLPIDQSYKDEINALIDDLKRRHTQFLDDIKV